MVAITQYYAKVGLSVDMVQLKKVDRYLSLVEKKLLAFQKKHIKQSGALNLKISIDEKSLVKKLGDALDRASSKVVVELKNFHINQQALSLAFQRASAGTSVGVGGLNTNTPKRRSQDSLQREGMAFSRAWNQAHAENARRDAPTPAGRSAPSASRANFLHAGGAGGALARYGVESLPFIGGAYGMQQLNQANQNMMSANIAAQSVLGPEANQRMDWLSQRSNYLGVNYSETLPQFTKFMASASPLLGGDSAQEVFSGFMQFGRTRGATGVSMNRALNAVAQMGAKGQIMQEELKGQLAEASGFGELPQLFAEAYQIQTGGSQTGAEARATLMKAMEDGLVKSDILPLVTKLMNELSKGGIEKARTSSVAEQERAMNALTGKDGLLQTFSNSGGEQGFSRFWKETARIFREMKPLVEGLGGAFNDLTKIMQPVAMVFEGWNKILETTAQLTGISKKSLLEFAAIGGLMASKWGRVATLFTSILLVMEDFAFGMAGKDSYTKDFLDFLQNEGLSTGQAKFAAIAAALAAVGAALAIISRNSMLPGIGDILGRKGGASPTGTGSTSGKQGFKMPWEKVGAGLVGAGLGAGAYYLGMGGDTNFMGSTGADLLTNSAAGLWLGGPYGAAAGAMWSLANPTWGAQLPVDEFGYKSVPSQNNDDLVAAMMAARGRGDGTSQQTKETNVSIKVDANITAQDSQGFAESLKLEIDRALGNYTLTQ